jgi:hypothetical protein
MALVGYSNVFGMLNSWHYLSLVWTSESAGCASAGKPALFYMQAPLRRAASSRTRLDALFHILTGRPRRGIW